MRRPSWRTGARWRVSTSIVPLRSPEQGWELLKIGGGTPPVRIPEGWLVLYHGVTGTPTQEPPPCRRISATAQAPSSWTAPM